jgi:branched-chain amino acid transport system permease protein
MNAPMPTPLARRPALWVTAAAIVLAFSVPFLVSDYDLFNLCRVMALAMCVASLNLVMGYSGQVSLGHGAIFGIGGYATMMSIAYLGLPVPLGLLVGVVVCMVVGVVIGLPAVRLGGFNLGLLTILIAALFPLFLYRFSDLTGGQAGVVLPVRPFPSPFPALTHQQWMYIVILALLVLVLLLLHRVVAGRTGRALASMRAGRILAVSQGVKVDRIKVQMFVISSAIAGLAGGLYGLVLGLVVPESYPLILSITLLVASVIGGSRSWLGAIAGAVIVIYLPTWSSALVPGEASAYFAQLVFAVVLGLCVVLAPNGLAGGVHSVLRALRSRLASPAPTIPINREELT